MEHLLTDSKTLPRACLFCFKQLGDVGASNEGDLPRFLCLWQRHLNSVLDGGRGGSEVAAVFKKIHELLTTTTSMREGRLLGSCDDCCKMQATFCDLFHRARCLLLEANWQLDKLTEVMRCADKVKSRLALVRTTIDKKGAEPADNQGFTVGGLLEARTQLLQIYSQPQGRAYPKLILKRTEKSLKIENDNNQDDVVDKPMEECLSDDESTLPAAEDCWMSSLEVVAHSTDPNSMTRVEVDAGVDSRVSTPEAGQPPTPSEIGSVSGDPDDEYSSSSSESDEDKDSDRSEEEEEVLKKRTRGWPTTNGALLASLDEATLNQPIYGNEELTLKTFLSEESLPKNYICSEDHCKYRFVFKTELDIHSKLHGKVNCKFCDLVVTYAPHLPLHEASLHGEEFKEKSHPGKRLQRRLELRRKASFKCARCVFSSDDKDSLIQHHLSFHLDLSWGKDVCPICWKQFPAKSEDKLGYQFCHHYCTHHNIFGMRPDEVQRCDECRAYFKESSQLLVHQRNVHGPKRHGEFPCVRCSHVVTYAPDLALHEATHEVDGPGKKFRCARCTFSSINAAFLIRHYLRKHLHLLTCTHKCQVCRHEFRRSNSLKQHVEHCHDVSGMDQSQISRCNECPAFFRLSIQLDRHCRVAHGSVDRQSCPDCGQIFRGNYWRRELRSHRIVSHKINPKDFLYACEVEGCEGVKFETKAHLEAHTRYNHLEGKGSVKVCPVCGKKCMGDLRLRSHELSHQRRQEVIDKTKVEKRWVCDVCGKVFGTKGSLKTHEVVHGDPELSCEVCGKRFRNKLNLSVHQRVHTKERPYVCKVCGQSFSHQHNMVRHQKTVHKTVWKSMHPKKKRL